MCMHSHARGQIQFLQVADGIPSQERYLTEGACPNRCGPLERAEEYVAVCKCCGIVWKSPRVAKIWPKELA